MLGLLSRDEVNFLRPEWLPALRALRIRPLPYNWRSTYIATLLDAGAKPLFVCRQTVTSLEMIERHYRDARVDADQLEEMIREARVADRKLVTVLGDSRHRERSRGRWRQ